jgi:hypothetical protein
MDEGELVFLSVFFAQVAPITTGMPPKEVAGLFAGFLERSESTGCGDDLTELKLFRHFAPSDSLLLELARSRIASNRCVFGSLLSCELLFADEAFAGLPIHDQKGFANDVGLHDRCGFHRVIGRHKCSCSGLVCESPDASESSGIRTGTRLFHHSAHARSRNAILACHQRE